MSIDSILALDVGGGTRDLLIWRRDQTPENAVKMVLPSPTRVAAGRIRTATSQGQAIYLDGGLMGGGPVTSAVSAHLSAGLEVWAGESAAATLYDDLQRVRDMGVVINEEKPPQAQVIPFGDLDLDNLTETCARFEVAMPGQLAVAVCDHGFSPGFSNRKFRFAMWREFLDKGGALGDLIFDQPPEHMTRMASIAEQAPGVLLMDTAAAALWGALQDPQVAARSQEGLCVVNAGNMHTVAFLVAGGRVQAIYEHHTKCLDTNSLGDQLTRFISGELSDDKVFDDRGHGCARTLDAPRKLAGPVVLTGPRRRLADGLGWQTAVPLGDVMLSGCFGLVAAARAALGEDDPQW